MSKYGINKTRKVNYRARARRKVGSIRGSGKCFVCGSEENITIHHDNGDVTDNRLLNLVTLCRKCHDEQHKLSQPNPEQKEEQ